MFLDEMVISRDGGEDAWPDTWMDSWTQSSGNPKEWPGEKSD